MTGAPGRRANSGFTLLEIMVVLAVLVTAVAVVMPSLVSGAGAEARAAAQTLAAGLRRTRAHALTHGNPAALTVDVDRRSFRLAGEGSERRLPERVTLKLFTARSEVQGEGRGRIRFFPDGSSTGGRITVGGGSRRFLVDVDWLTGRVRIYDDVGEEEPGLDVVGQVVQG